MLEKNAKSVEFNSIDGKMHLQNLCKRKEIATLWYERNAEMNHSAWIFISAISQ